MIRLISLSVIIVLLSSFSIKKLEKKIDKNIKKTFGSQEISKRYIGETEKNLHWFKLNSADNKNKGYVCVTQAKSRSDVFEYMIVFTPTKIIKDIHLLTYREEYGGEIGSKRFLKQFFGKNSKSEMRLNKEIDGISGATISCQSITKSIKEMSVKITSVE